MRAIFSSKVQRLSLTSPPLLRIAPRCQRYLDNKMAGVQQVFVDYIARHDFEAGQALEVATKLEAIGITTVKDFVGYFSHLNEGPTVFKFWNSIAEWKNQRQLSC